MRTRSLSLALLGGQLTRALPEHPFGAWQRAGHLGHRLGQTWQGLGVAHVLVDAPGVTWGTPIPSLSGVYFRSVLLSLMGRPAGQPHQLKNLTQL